MKVIYKIVQFGIDEENTKLQESVTNANFVESKQLMNRL